MAKWFQSLNDSRSSEQKRCRIYFNNIYVLNNHKNMISIFKWKTIQRLNFQLIIDFEKEFSTYAKFKGKNLLLSSFLGFFLSCAAKTFTRSLFHSNAKGTVLLKYCIFNGKNIKWQKIRIYISKWHILTNI